MKHARQSNVPMVIDGVSCKTNKLLLFERYVLMSQVIESKHVNSYFSCLFSGWAFSCNKFS